MGIFTQRWIHLRQSSDRHQYLTAADIRSISIVPRRDFTGDYSKLDIPDNGFAIAVLHKEALLLYRAAKSEEEAIAIAEELMTTIDAAVNS